MQEAVEESYCADNQRTASAVVAIFRESVNGTCRERPFPIQRNYWRSWHADRGSCR